MKRSVALILGALLGAVFFTAGSSAATAAPYCGITWGSVRDTQNVQSMDAAITNARAGEHACFDRFVVDVRGDIHGFDVQYTQVTNEGTGAAIPLRGAADLKVVAYAKPYDANGVTTYSPVKKTEAVNVTGYQTFRQVAFADTHAGQSTFGLGVRARLPFRTFILDGPGDGSRLVVDVAHRW